MNNIENKFLKFDYRLNNIYALVKDYSNNIERINYCFSLEAILDKEKFPFKNSDILDNFNI